MVFGRPILLCWPAVLPQPLSFLDPSPMSETQPPPQSRLNVFLICVVLLLLVQTFFSWTHGRLLYRQQQEIRALREEVQRLADALEGEAPTELEEDPESFSQGSYGSLKSQSFKRQGRK